MNVPFATLQKMVDDYETKFEHTSYYLRDQLQKIAKELNMQPSYIPPAPTKTDAEVFSPTGAVRSTIHGPDGPRYDLMMSNNVAMRRIAETFGEGFKKYGADNWKKGFPTSEYYNHAMIHLSAWTAGDFSEDHLAHACWNLMAIMWQEENKPELQDYPKLSLK